MTQATKIIRRAVDIVNGEQAGFTERTFEALCSVELGATAKGEPQVKSVKVYATDSREAAQQALDTFDWLVLILGGENI